MMVYNPVNDVWNKIDLFMNNGRMNISKNMTTMDGICSILQID